MVDGSSNVVIEDCTVENCFNSGVWAKGGSLCHVEGGKIDGCGGYGAVYCTNGAGCLSCTTSLGFIWIVASLMGISGVGLAAGNPWSACTIWLCRMWCPCLGGVEGAP